MIRIREILQEAWRNTATGTARPLLAIAVFATVIGTLGIIQARGVVDITTQAQRWRAAGASIMVVALDGQIDGAQCDALSTMPGIAAAGALRQAQPVHLAAMPSTPLQTFQATPGLATVLRVERLTDTGVGIWLADDLSQNTGTAQLQDTHGNQIEVAGTYAYPSDGRVPTLAYTAISPTPAAGRFDACWVELWPESDQARSLLTLPVVSTLGPDGKPLTPQVQQLNTSLGARFGAADRLATLPTWPLTTAAALTTAALAVALLRSRRIELAAALHAGVDTPSLALQTAAECLIWTGAALPLLGVSFWWAATQGNPDPPWSALYPAIRTALVASLAALLTTVLTTVLTRERHLFRYFKAR